MKLIAHRGNISGKDEKENQPNYVLRALRLGYNVEVDVWWHRGEYYLGHDEPTYKVWPRFIENKDIWCHAKNSDALCQMKENPNIHYFWHEQDTYTITSRGFVWVFPNKPLLPNSICVKPELRYNGDLTLCSGICSDYISDYGELNDTNMLRH
jgi:hypothetical protein